VQLGDELTVPAKVFQAAQVVPLKTLTDNVAFALNAAHATELDATAAQDGVPITVPVPAAVIGVHAPHAAGANPKQVSMQSTYPRFRFIFSLISLDR
jgi:hypothetical protein